MLHWQLADQSGLMSYGLNSAFNKTEAECGLVKNMLLEKKIWNSWVDSGGTDQRYFG